MSLTGRDPHPDAPSPGRVFGGGLCGCDCHYNPDVRHVAPCCDGGYDVGNVSDLMSGSPATEAYKRMKELQEEERGG